MTDRPAVTDWTSDFDHFDPAWGTDPFAIWDDLRQTCPVAHTDRYGGVYLPTRNEDVRAIALDHERFSSRRVIVRGFMPARGGATPPITSDPPRHQAARRALLPAFTPVAIDRYVERTRAICNALIDDILAGARANGGRCDAALAYSQHVPVLVIAMMLGVPDSDGDMFRRWIQAQIESVDTSEDLERSTAEMTEYCTAYIEARRKSAEATGDPGDDLIGLLLKARYPDGLAFKPNHVVGSLRLLLIAGIDTTWSAIGASLWHLAATPADRARLVAEPALIPTAVEEFLRAFSPVTMARVVARDTEVAGCPMRAGEMVLLSFPAANRDPAQFPDPEAVLIDRRENRHAAFGLGIHRCIGSNLARMELNVAIDTWLRRIPEFALDGDVTWSLGQVRGPRKLPLRIATA